MIQFKISGFNKTALQIAVERSNVQIVKLLLNNNKLDINQLSIFIQIFINIINIQEFE